MQNNYQPVVGLEVHVELRTRSKMFCGCPADHFGKPPNTQVCPVCLGLPGALPVPNALAVSWTQILGAALGCDLAKSSHFERKHYFYPDLPKGYQISQYERPLAENGRWKTEDGKRIRIRRVHLEEDTGKLFHQEKTTLIDFNRSGVPLVEIVTEPDFSSASEAVGFVKTIQQLVRYLGISDADMEKGSMRLEANISLRTNHQLPDYRVELKNINSFRFMEQAINYEIERQSKILSAGGKLTQETRGFDQKTGTTKEQRWKEVAADYRYFPEPDIPPLSFDAKYLAKIAKELPELPHAKHERFQEQYGLSEQYARLLTQTRQLADYFEEVVRVGKDDDISAKKIADTMVNKKPDVEKILPAKLVEILRKPTTKAVLSNEELERTVVQSIKENPRAVEDYKKGKEAALQFLVGQVMSKTKGAADPEKVREKLKAKLS